MGSYSEKIGVLMRRGRKPDISLRHTEERPCENTTGSWWSARQKERPHHTLSLTAS